MAKVKSCSQCGAPLPDLSAGSVNCQFCGALNAARHGFWQRMTTGATGQADRSRVVIVAAVAGVVSTLLMALAGFSMSEVSRAPVQEAAEAVQAQPPPPPPPPLPAPPPPAPWGALHAVAVDERGDILAVLGDALVKVDRATFTAKWVSSFSSQWQFAGNYRIIVPRGDYVAVISDRMALFVESASGAQVNEFKYRTGGILQRVCAAGSTQVLVDVLGEKLQRFDAATGLRATSGPDCALREKLGCPSTQRCGWERHSSATHDCRYAVRVGSEVFRDCTTEDGQQRAVLLAQGPKDWEVPSSSRVDTYFGVVDETLIVGGSRGIVALNTATGDERWRRHGESQSALVADGTTVYFGFEGTLVAANARTGAELQRLPLRAVTAAVD